VTFTDASIEVDCPIESWTWEVDGVPFWGNQTPPPQTFTHSAATPATRDFVVTLTVASGGGSDAVSQTITVATDSTCQEPIPSFEGSPGGGPAPLEVVFTDTSEEVDCEITSWAWDFGDETPIDPRENPTHVFEEPGTFTITLTVTSDAGDAEATAQITVDPPDAP
jgi:PKD repeat protein